MLTFILQFCHAQIIISVRLYCKYCNVVKALFSARPYEPSVMIGYLRGPSLGCYRHGEHMVSSRFHRRYWKKCFVEIVQLYMFSADYRQSFLYDVLAVNECVCVYTFETSVLKN